MSMAALVVMAGLWPFGRGPDVAVPTVADAGAVSEAPAAAPPPADPAVAAAAYAAFLASPAATDPAMRLTALRRLADLRLEAAEIALMEGASAEADLAEAIQLYRALLDDPATRDAAPEWRDHWSYQLARAESMAGRDHEAESVLASLVASRPDSALAPEAWFRLGEARFLARDWHAAEQAYLATLELEAVGPFSEQAIYKLGWTLFKQSEHQRSFAPFATVIEGRLSATPLEDLDRAGRELVDDSFRAMAIGFSALDGAASVGEWLDGREAPAPEWAYLAYERLGELYIEQQRWTDAATAFGAWAQRSPLDERAPGLQGRAIDALGEGGFAGEALEAMAAYVERFSQQGAWWRSRDAGEHTAVHERLKSSLDTLAAHHHAEFQAGAGSAAIAAAWYRCWLEEFPQEPEAAERHFLLAELYYGDGDLHEAADAYWSAAYAYGAHPQAAEAGYAAVVTRRDLASLAVGDELAETTLIEAALAFSDAFPADTRGAEVELEAAERLMRLGRLEAARTAAARLLGRVDAPAAPRAAALLVSAHAAFDLGEYAAAESDYLAWQAHVTISAEVDGTELAPQVRERIAASIYHQAQDAAELGMIQEAVGHFERIGAVVPESPVAATGQHDAAALLFNASEWLAAAAAYEVFLKRWPAHELAAGASVSFAAALVELGDHARAAPALAAVSTLPGESEEVRRAALWQAAELYEATGDSAAAESTLRSYLERFPDPADAALEARHRLAGFAGRRNDLAERHRWLESIISAHDVAGDAATPRSRTLAAAASLELAMPIVDRFEALSLSPPLERSVPEKAGRMRTALDALGVAAGYGVAEITTEATYRMADLYRGMAVALLESARPPGLDEDTLEQYEMLLEEQAFPFEEDAIAIHEANVARARDGLYDRWVVASFEALAEMVPARWNRQETGEHVVELHR
jgi:cellulose synthase operon protein C